MKVRHAGYRGAVLIEFALIAPLVLLLIFGALEFGLLFWASLTMQQALIEGARLAGEQADAATVLQRVAEQSMGLYARLQPEVSYGPVGAKLIMLRLDCRWPVNTPLLAPLFPDGYRFSVATALRGGG
jgi:Flp pilus assembly protein TadG